MLTFQSHIKVMKWGNRKGRARFAPKISPTDQEQSFRIVTCRINKWLLFWTSSSKFSMTDLFYLKDRHFYRIIRFQCYFLTNCGEHLSWFCSTDVKLFWRKNEFIDRKKTWKLPLFFSLFIWPGQTISISLSAKIKSALHLACFILFYYFSLLIKLSLKTSNAKKK